MVNVYHLINGSIVMAETATDGTMLNPCFRTVQQTKEGPVPFFQTLKIFGNYIHNDTAPPFKDHHVMIQYEASTEECEMYRHAVETIRQQNSPILDPKSPVGRSTLHNIGKRRQ